MSELVVRAVLGQPPQVVSQQQLVAGDPLDRLQHVVLQRQAAAHLSALRERKRSCETGGSGLFTVRRLEE